jgi:pimeloyl-ACP methyl ester carboxylesterase
MIPGSLLPTMPLVNARLMSALLRNATVHVIPGGGHLALLTHLDEFLPLLRGFLRGSG